MVHENFVEERLLGMMAVEKRLITEKQLTECLNTIELFEPDKSLIEVLIEKEYLTKKQIERLRKQLKASIEVKDKPSNLKRFGDIALDQCMIDTTQLEEALKEQEKYLERGLRVQLGQIMFKKGYLTMAQVKRILESQLQKVLYCKNCKITKVINNYNPGKIYQCEKCKLDLIEAPKKLKKKVKKKVKVEDDIDEGDIGKLDILEL